MSRRKHASELLREWRIDHDLTQGQAAEQLETSQPNYCDWENGKKDPRVDTCLQIAKKTGGCVPVESWSQSLRVAKTGTEG